MRSPLSQLKAKLRLAGVDRESRASPFVLENIFTSRGEGRARLARRRRRAAAGIRARRRASSSSSGRRRRAAASSSSVAVAVRVVVRARGGARAVGRSSRLLALDNAARCPTLLVVSNHRFGRVGQCWHGSFSRYSDRSRSIANGRLAERLPRRGLCGASGGGSNDASYLHSGAGWFAARYRLGR